MKKQKADSFRELTRIMKTLRGKKGCPWDKKQTHKTLLPYLLEESYEVIEAVNKNDSDNLKEELGDVLLQVVFHSQIADDKGRFDIDDVIETINNKLISRHPHVFASKKGLTKDWHVRDFWEENKRKSKKRDSVLEGVPKALPALLRSRRLQSKAQSTGFKWRTLNEIYAKVEEEMGEVRSSIKSRNRRHIEEEIGDLFFVLVSLSYYNKINPENALQKANDKFMRRFRMIEKKINKDMSAKDMLKLWKSTKPAKRKAGGPGASKRK